jgi:nitrogen regulatory protein A
MDDYETEVIGQRMNHIRISSYSDFAALALLSEDHNRYRWYLATGNRNIRYKKMLVRRGKGLPGMALLLGRSFTIDRREVVYDRLENDCPLMIAEGLQVAVAIPLLKLTEPIGILMVGIRHEKGYSQSDLITFHEGAKELERVLEVSKHKVYG